MGFSGGGGHGIVRTLRTRRTARTGRVAANAMLANRLSAVTLMAHSENPGGFMLGIGYFLFSSEAARMIGEQFALDRPDN